MVGLLHEFDHFGGFGVVLLLCWVVLGVVNDCGCWVWFGVLARFVLGV